MEDEHDDWLDGSPLPDIDWLKELDTLALMYAEGFAAAGSGPDVEARRGSGQSLAVAPTQLARVSGRVAPSALEKRASRVEIKLAAYALSEFFGVWFPTALAMTICLHCGDPPSWHRVNAFCRSPDGCVNCPCRTYEADFRGRLLPIGR